MCRAVWCCVTLYLKCPCTLVALVLWRLWGSTWPSLRLCTSQLVIFSLQRVCFERSKGSVSWGADSEAEQGLGTGYLERDCPYVRYFSNYFCDTGKQKWIKWLVYVRWDVRIVTSRQASFGAPMLLRLVLPKVRWCFEHQTPWNNGIKFARLLRQRAQWAQ